MTDPAPRPRLHEVFRNRNFRRLWFGQVVSYLGDRIDQMAMIAVLGASASTAARGADHANLVTFWATLPYLAMSPFAGALVDRMDRRRLMIAADLFRGAVVLAVPFVVSPASHPWIVYAVVGLIGAATSVFAPARSALMPEIVPGNHLLRANSVTTTMGTVTILAGTVLGGKLVTELSQPNWLVDRIGPWLYWASLPAGLAVALALDAATYFFSAAMLSGIRTGRRGAAPPVASPSRGILGGYAAGLREGMVRVRRSRVTTMAVLLDSWFFLAGGILFAGITRLVFVRLVPANPGAAPEMLGYAYGALGLGLALGGVAVGRHGGHAPLRRLLPACYAAAGLCSAALACPLGAAASCGILAALGFSAGGIVVTIETVLQKSVAPEFRGRVFALNNLALNTTLLVSVGAATVALSRGWMDHVSALSLAAVLAGTGAALGAAGLPRGTSAGICAASD